MVCAVFKLESSVAVDSSRAFSQQNARHYELNSSQGLITEAPVDNAAFHLARHIPWGSLSQIEMALPPRSLKAAQYFKFESEPQSASWRRPAPWRLWISRRIMSCFGRNPPALGPSTSDARAMASSRHGANEREGPPRFYKSLLVAKPASKCRGSLVSFMHHRRPECTLFPRRSARAWWAIGWSEAPGVGDPCGH